MSTHQKMSAYNGDLQGTPRYQGLEYDWEVPDDVVVASPGGVSSVHHHWTKGFNGRGNTSSDIYAGQGQRYNSGIYGGLYQQGHESSQQYYSDPPDYEYWGNQDPSQSSYTNNDKASRIPSQKPFTNTIEKFEQDPDFELVGESGSHSESLTLVALPSVRPWLVLLLFLFGFIVYDAWASVGHSYITQVWNRGKELSWKQYLVYAIALTVVLVAFAKIAGLPIQKLEDME